MGTTEQVYGTDRVIADALRERKRQVVVEGFTRLGDDQHSPGRLALAAAAYLVSWAGAQMIGRESGESQRVLRSALEEAGPPDFWPMDPQWWKPHNDRHDLIRAIALAIAEVEHHDRAADGHPRRGQLTALDDRLDADAHVLDRAGMHIHLAPGQRLAAVGDRVLIETEGRPISELGLDELEWHDGDGQWRPFTGLVIEQGETVADALRRSIGPQGQARLILDRVSTLQVHPTRERAEEVAQRFPADTSGTCASSGLDSAPAVESSPVDCPADSGVCGSAE